MRHPRHSSASRGKFNNLWNRSTERVQEAAKSAKAKLRQIDVKIGPLMDRLVDAESKTVAKACERKISQLEVEKEIYAQQAKTHAKTPDPIEGILESALRFLASSWKIASSGKIQKRLVLRLAFSARIPYSRSEGPRTAILALPFKVSDNLKHPSVKMVGPAGLEPATYRL